jgi:hypothetical protein
MQMLEAVLDSEVVNDPDSFPVTAELFTKLKAVLDAGDEDDVPYGYDIDAVLFYMALAMMKMETALLMSRAETRNLEARLLKSGVRVRPS